MVSLFSHFLNSGFLISHSADCFFSMFCCPLTYCQGHYVSSLSTGLPPSSPNSITPEDCHCWGYCFWTRADLLALFSSSKPLPCAAVPIWSMSYPCSNPSPAQFLLKCFTPFLWNYGPILLSLCWLCPRGWSWRGNPSLRIPRRSLVMLTKY